MGSTYPSASSPTDPPFTSGARALALAALLMPGNRPNTAVAVDSPFSEPSAKHGAGDANVRSSTLGGKQFWADELVYFGWRVQRHVYTGHYRLLDEDNVRHAWGTIQECRAALAQIKCDRGLPDVRGQVVLVLHGLIRTRSSMNALCRHLAKHSDFTVMSVGYPSTRAPVATHARSLARIIEHLPQAEKIHLVAHSMGNIVVRHYLGDEAARAAVGEPTELSRIGRIVMIAPPNQGSRRAEVWQRNFVFQTVLGDPGQELAGGFAALKRKLARPVGEFGIIAGGKGDGRGWRSYLQGDDDGTVTVSSTRLAGARDFRCLPCRHTFIMNDPRVLDFTLRFLQSGCFGSEHERQPVEEDGQP